jgi:hypothetical protein
MVLWKPVCGVAVLILLVVGVLVPAVISPGTALAGSCCQCPLPTCGPPKNGQCASSCTLVANATCNGKIGRCQADKRALAPESQDSNMTSVAYLEGLILRPVDVQLVGGSR